MFDVPARMTDKSDVCGFASNLLSELGPEGATAVAIAAKAHYLGLNQLYELSVWREVSTLLADMRTRPDGLTEQGIG